MVIGKAKIIQGIIYAKSHVRDLRKKNQNVQCCVAWMWGAARTRPRADIDCTRKDE